MSRVTTCHVSRVTCHIYIYIYIFFFFTKWWSLLVEGLLSTGPTPSSLLTFEMIFPILPIINHILFHRRTKDKKHVFRKSHSDLRQEDNIQIQFVGWAFVQSGWFGQQNFSRPLNKSLFNIAWIFSAQLEYMNKYLIMKWSQVFFFRLGPA